MDREGATPAHCTQCECPIVLFESTTAGYELGCCCRNRSVDVNGAASGSSLFTPMTGVWSGVDDVAPWGDAPLGDDGTDGE
ncbi:MAG: hypothetical protein A07HR60_01444 [uncultured archaeon A07HR60]|nr:MAG: hypothetical protein A07HR60_01444 [uncultured archaeon A07HR60]